MLVVVTVLIRLSIAVVHGVLTDKNGSGEAVYAAVRDISTHPDWPAWLWNTWSPPLFWRGMIEGDQLGSVLGMMDGRESDDDTKNAASCFRTEWKEPYERHVLSVIWTVGSLVVVHPSAGSALYWREALWWLHHHEEEATLRFFFEDVEAVPLTMPQYLQHQLPWYVLYFPKWCSKTSLAEAFDNLHTTSPSRIGGGPDADKNAAEISPLPALPSTARRLPALLCGFPLVMLHAAWRTISPVTLLLSLLDGASAAVWLHLLPAPQQKNSGTTGISVGFPLPGAPPMLLLWALFVLNPVMAVLPLLESLCCLEGGVVAMGLWASWSCGGRLVAWRRAIRKQGEKPRHSERTVVMRKVGPSSTPRTPLTPKPHTAYRIIGMVLPWLLSLILTAGLGAQLLPALLVLWVVPIGYIFMVFVMEGRQGGSGPRVFGPFSLWTWAQIGIWVWVATHFVVAITFVWWFYTLGGFGGGGGGGFRSGGRYDPTDHYAPSLSFYWYARSLLHYPEYQTAFDFMLHAVPVWLSLTFALVMCCRVLSEEDVEEKTDPIAARDTITPSPYVMDGLLLGLLPQLSVMLSLLFRPHLTLFHLVLLLLLMSCEAMEGIFGAMFWRPNGAMVMAKNDSCSVPGFCSWTALREIGWPGAPLSVAFLYLVVSMLAVVGLVCSCLHSWLAQGYYLSGLGMVLEAVFVGFIGTTICFWVWGRLYWKV